MVEIDNRTDAVFVWNYDHAAERWDNIPTGIWSSIVSTLERLHISAFGLQDIVASDAIRHFKCFEGVPLSIEGVRDYLPYHGESSREIMSFGFEDAIKEVFLSEAFDQWSRESDELPADELVFFTPHHAKVLAIPYENLVRFYNLSSQDINVLSSLDSDLASHLYTSDMRRLISQRHQ